MSKSWCCVFFTKASEVVRQPGFNLSLVLLLSTSRLFTDCANRKPCDPNDGLTEVWPGWTGWENYATTDKKFKGWYCFEQA